MAKSSPRTHILSATCTLLPLLLLIPAFTLGTYSAHSKRWSYHANYDANSNAMTNITHRSPFISCTLETIIPNDTSSSWTKEDCSSIRKPSGLCDATATSTKTDNAHFCEQLSLSARLLYAGLALMGAALILGLGLTGLTLPQVFQTGSYRDRQAQGEREGRHHHGHVESHQRPAVQSMLAYANLLLRLTSIFGGVILFLGSILAANTLLNINFPIGDWYSNSADPSATSISDVIANDHVGPWLMGKAVGLSVAGATLAIVAGALAGMVWETPRVGVVGPAVSRHAAHEAVTSKTEE